MFLMNRGDRRIEKLKELSRKTRISFIDASDLREIDYLSLVPDAESAGIMGLREIDSAVLARNCGIIDPVLLCKYYYDECMALGVEFIFNFDARDLELEPVNRLDFPGEPFIWQDKRIRIIKSGSREIEAETFILATDVWTTALLDLTGIDSHVRPKKRQVFQVGGDKIPEMVFDDSFTGEGICPFTILPRDGIYLRPAPLEKSFWVGVADDIGRDFSLSEDPQPEIPFYDMNLLQVIRSYFPAFSRTKMTSGWAGYYSYNTIDKAPYIFRTLNLLIATGTSGSGILKGDGIGRTVEAVYSGRSSVKLHNGLEFDPAMLGVKGRNVEPEEIIL
ncbi:MAG: FAD-binding oxidoreductase [Candidatus Thermoplasmatota archaeon]|nr:FAD-binding oxidoreductase [Candidatus Thermoplasmatota archaeon]